MTSLNHRESMNKIFEYNKEKIRKFRELLSSLAKIEDNLETKIKSHNDYIDFLQKNLQIAINAHYTICKNLTITMN